MKKSFVLLILTGLCGIAHAQLYLDRVLLGDSRSEKLHGYTTYCPDYVKVKDSGLLGESGRLCLQYPNNPYSGIYTGINGGEYQVVLKVDGNKQNYLTTRYSGNDTGYEIHYTADVDGKILSNISGSLVQYSTTPKAPGAFLYRTYSIPRSETDGKREVVVRIRSKGRYYQYGTPGTFTTYQRVLDQDMPPLYALYTHTNPSFEIPSDEKLGNITAYEDAPVKTGKETDLTRIKATAISKINQQINNILNNTSYSKSTAGSMLLLAAAYTMPQYVAYQNPKVVEKVKWALDEMVKRHNDGSITANSEWGGAFGFHGYAMYKVRNGITDKFLDEAVNLGRGSKSRRAQWIEAIKTSFDHGAKDRRTLSNQVAWASTPVYGASLGLYALDSLTYANFPKIGHQVVREAAGLDYFTGPLKSVEAPDPQLGDYTDVNGPCGAYYRMITSKGGGREFPGWVCPGCYGYLWQNYFEMWDMMCHDPYLRGKGGDRDFLDRIAEYERLNASLSYPSTDADGNRAMLCHSVTCSRIIREPGFVYYGDVTVAGMTGDKELLGHARQMYEDRQHTWDSPAADRLYGLYTPQAVDSLVKYSECRAKLPFTSGQEDALVTDEENGMVAFSHNGEIIYINFSNNMAQHIAKNYTKAINFVPDTVKYYSSGRKSTVQMEPHNSAHRVYFPDRPLLAGGGTEFELPSYNHTKGVYNNRQPFLDFYQLRYNKYLIGMNTGYFDDTVYEIEVPQELRGKTVYNLTTKQNVTLGEKLPVPPGTTYVLYVEEGSRKKRSSLQEVPGDPAELKARTDELTAFIHANRDSIALSGMKVVNAFPHDKFTVFWRELTFANYAANCGTMPQHRLDSALVELNNAYDKLLDSRLKIGRSDLPGKIDFTKRLDSGGRFTLDKESGVLKNVYSTFMVFPVHAVKEGFYTIVARIGTKRNPGLNPRVNVTFFDERGYSTDSASVAANTRKLVLGTDWDDYLEYTWDVFLREGENKLLKLSVGIQSDILAAAQIESITAEYKDFTSSENAWLFQVPKDNPVLYKQFEDQFAKKDPASPWDFKTYTVANGMYNAFARSDANAPKCEGIPAYYNNDEWFFITKNGYVHPLVEMSPAIVYTAPEDGIYCVNTTIQRQNHNVDNYMYTRYRFAAGGIKDGVTSVSRDKFMFSDAYGHKNNNVPVSREFYVRMKKGDAITFEEDAYTPNRISSGGSTWEYLMVSKVPADRVESVIKINADKYYDQYGNTGIDEVENIRNTVEIIAIADEKGVQLYSTSELKATVYNAAGEPVMNVQLGTSATRVNLPAGFYLVKAMNGSTTVKLIVE